MGRKGFTAQGPWQGITGGFGTGPNLAVSRDQLDEVARAVDALRRDDGLALQRELLALREQVDALDNQTPRSFAFAKVTLVSGVVDVDSLESENLNVTAVGSVLTLAFDANVPTTYAVQCTMGPTTTRVVYQATTRQNDFDIEQRDLSDVVVAFTALDSTIHIVVVGG